MPNLQSWPIMTIRQSLLSLCALLWLAVFSAAFVQLGPSGSNGSSGNTYTSVIRTSDAVQTSNGTPTNDDTLLFPISANAGDIYIFDAYIEYQATTTADILVSFSVPAGATGSAIVYKLATAGTVCSTTASMEPLLAITDASGAGGVGATSSCMVSIKGYVVSGGTAGNVNFEWSQRVSDPSNTPRGIRRPPPSGIE